MNIKNRLSYLFIYNAIYQSILYGTDSCIFYSGVLYMAGYGKGYGTVRNKDVAVYLRGF